MWPESSIWGMCWMKRFKMYWWGGKECLDAILYECQEPTTQESLLRIRWKEPWQKKERPKKTLEEKNLSKKLGNGKKSTVGSSLSNRENLETHLIGKRKDSRWMKDFLRRWERFLWNFTMIIWFIRENIW